MMDLINSCIAPILALIVVLGGGIAYYYAPENKATAIVAIISTVVGYYFGSSTGSRDKDRTIKDAMECKEGEKGNEKAS